MMSTSLEELRVLQDTEKIADSIWEQVVGWDRFACEVVGGQLARAADSIGANIAEAFGRFNFGEKLQFLYYARGSLFETKYWLNRAAKRGLLEVNQVANYASQLSDVGRQLNAFANSIKKQRYVNTAPAKSIREVSAEYATMPDNLLFTEAELNWLQAVPTGD